MKGAKSFGIRQFDGEGLVSIHEAGHAVAAVAVGHHQNGAAIERIENGEVGRLRGQCLREAVWNPRKFGESFGGGFLLLFCYSKPLFDGLDDNVTVVAKVPFTDVPVAPPVAGTGTRSSSKASQTSSTLECQSPSGATRATMPATGSAVS
jgi:hypothetical protein